MSIDLVSLLVGIVAGAAVYGVYSEIRRMNAEIAYLKEEKLKAQPHGTLATLEDIQAIVTDVRFQNVDVDDVIQALIVSETKRKYDDFAFERVAELVHDIRQAPRKYKDRPNRKVNLT